MRTRSIHKHHSAIISLLVLPMAVLPLLVITACHSSESARSYASLYSVALSVCWKAPS